MIYILIEHVMNGTVTMNTITTGVEAETFKDAIEKVKGMEGFRKFKPEINKETDKEFEFQFPNQDLPVWGGMTDKPIKIIT